MWSQVGRAKVQQYVHGGKEAILGRCANVRGNSQHTLKPIEMTADSREANKLNASTRIPMNGNAESQT